MTRLRRAFAAAAVSMAGLIGCQLIVSDTVPDYRCTPGVLGACPPGQTCDPGTFTCVAGNPSDANIVDVVPPADRDVAADDDDDDSEVDAAKGALIGEACSTSKTCATGLLCGAPNMLTTAIVASDESLCTKTCCTSEECPDGFVCFGAGTGGNYCVSQARAKRSDLGTKKPGADCADNTECRSGTCLDNHCLDLCCKVSDCVGGTTCRVKSISAPAPARENWVCALPEPGANTVAASGCGGGLQCINDNCQGLPAVCRPTCCKHDECAYPGKNLSFCAYGSFPTTQSTTKWCFTDAGPPVGLPVGAACNGNGECAQRFCDPDFKTCGTICCRDGDCATDEVCRPTATGQPFLRCIKAK